MTHNASRSLSWPLVSDVHNHAQVKAAANTVQAVNGAAAAEGPAAAKAAPAPDTATSSGGPSLHSTPSAGRTNGKRDDEGNAGLRGDKKKAAGLAEAEREGGGRSGVGSGAEASRRGQGSGSQAAEKPSSTVGQSQASSKEKRKGGKRKEGAASQQWPDAGPVAVVAKRQKTEDGKAALVARASVRFLISAAKLLSWSNWHVRGGGTRWDMIGCWMCERHTTCAVQSNFLL